MFPAGLQWLGLCKRIFFHSTVGFDDYGSECDGIRITAFLDAGQDNLTPLGRLEKYAFSENVFNR